MRQHDGRGFDVEIEPPRNQILNGKRRSPVGYVDSLRRCANLGPCGSQLFDISITGRTEIELARLLFKRGNETFYVAGHDGTCTAS
jgi:hypothetical protein